MSVRKIADIRMELSKVVFVAVFALCAIQAQSAEIPEFRNATHLDIRLFVTNGAAIAKNMFAALNSGLDKSKPNVDAILNEMAPEFRDLARKTIDKVRAFIRDEEKRIDHIFTTLEKALNTMKPIKPCYDKYSPAAKKIALKNEKETAKLITNLQKKYKDDLQNINVGINKTVNSLRKLFDTQVDATIKCLKPGRKDAKECLNREMEKTIKAIFDAATNLYLIITTAQDTLGDLVIEFSDGIQNIMVDVIFEGKPVLNDFADCVSKMKA